jgi:hypothetical protein
VSCLGVCGVCEVDSSRICQRRLEELRLEGLGLSFAEIIAQVSEKFGCGSRIVYNDFQTRTSWQPTLQGVNKSQDWVLKTLNRDEHIYRQASRILHSESNPLVQLGALNTMLKANSSMREIAVASCKPLEVEVANKNSTVIKMWQPNDEPNRNSSKVLPLRETKKLP